MRDFSLASGATEIYLIRHADARPHDDDADVDETYLDAPLSALGREQARALAARFAYSELRAVIASPLRRTLETASALIASTTRELTLDERLREVHIGELDPAPHDDDSTTAASVRARLDRLADIAIRDGGWSHLPGTESSVAVRSRMRAAIDDAVATYPGTRIAVVSHAGAINAYLADLLGIPSDFFFPAANASISLIRAHESRRLLVGLNDIAHLHAARRS